ncbi:hypothetical protein BHE74_00015212 [Ensete ventricosum]|nr:hypothetical protein BHE74_00015212 [Ensete ventricosum]RZS08021.1 hypothetical protein BHM03_00038946 [Ensete ventricosum]
MAAAMTLGSILPAISPPRLPSLSPSPSPEKSRRGAGLISRRHRRGPARWTAMVQQQTFQGPSAAYAREMERLSAKESLLLAVSLSLSLSLVLIDAFLICSAKLLFQFKDAGGFQSLISGQTTELQRIDVNERIVSLERLNPTARPTTYIESKFLLTTKLSLEGPSRMKEEYVEGTLETPTVSQEAVPEQLKGAVGQANSALQQLPAPIKDAFANGLKIPLSNYSSICIRYTDMPRLYAHSVFICSGTFERMFMISYLDEEILITRDSAGAPDVLTRLEGSPASSATDPMVSEYES